MNINEKTAFVTLTDSNYFYRAKRTIVDLRNQGNWNGTIVCIGVNFIIPEDFKKEYNVTSAYFHEIDKRELVENLGSGFQDSDGRELSKLNQWEKFHVFDKFFLKWERIVFLDAGMRILDSVKYLLDLDYENTILAPNDAGHTNRSDKIFSTQISFKDENLVNKLKADFGEDILDSQYFLNCIWIYDTNLLHFITKDILIDAMNKYPLCKTNEMTIMNLIFHFQYKVWKAFPHFIVDENNKQKYLFDWCELNNPGTKWEHYCYLKYPVSIGFDKPTLN